MAEPNVIEKVLISVADEGTDRFDWDRVARQTAQRVAHEAQREQRGRGPRTRVRTDWVVVALPISVAIIVAVVAVTVLHRARGGQTSTASPRALIAHLAVLRRPQTRADELPTEIGVGRYQLETIPSLTRLAVAVPGARMYLVVTPPGRGLGPAGFWPAKLGDQVSVVTVTRYGRSATFRAPAADLYDATGVMPVLDERSPSGQRIGQLLHRGEHGPVLRAYYVQVVPDGVRRVVWFFSERPGGHPQPVTAHVENNVAYTLPRPIGSIVKAEWFGANGKRVHLSDAPFQRVVTQSQERRKLQMLRIYSRYHYQAAPQILREYPVFSITSRTPVTVAPGITVSRPRLSTLPFTAVNFADPREPPQLDPSQIRQITYHGIRIWVVPGAKGICLSAEDRPSAGGGSGGASSCASRLSQATQGIGFTSSGTDFGSTTYMVLPTTHPTIRIRTGPHSFRTIRPPYGIYVHIAKRR
jgi:hypothetical protein